MRGAPKTTPKCTPKTLKFGQLEKQLSIAQVAEFTGTSEPTVRRWISEGKLRAYRYSARVIRIDESDVLGMREEVNPTTFAHINGGE